MHFVVNSVVALVECVEDLVPATTRDFGITAKEVDFEKHEEVKILTANETMELTILSRKMTTMMSCGSTFLQDGGIYLQKKNQTWPSSSINIQYHRMMKAPFVLWTKP